MFKQNWFVCNIFPYYIVKERKNVTGKFDGEDEHLLILKLLLSLPQFELILTKTLNVKKITNTYRSFSKFLLLNVQQSSCNV